MINSYTTATQTLAVDELVVFATDRIKTGCTVSHTAGSTTFTLNRPGYYYITVNADVASSDTTGNLTLSLYRNGVAVPGAESTSYAATASTSNNLSFSTIVQVRPSCCAMSNATSLTIVNTGIAATVANANIVITKLA